MTKSEAFRQYVTDACAAGEWLVWAEFIERARVDLAKRAHTKDTLKAWRKTRAAVLSELAALGLTATIERTHGAVPIENHEADLAGLVRFHAPGAPPPAGAGVTAWGPTAVAYAERMAAAYGLTPCRGLPTSLRGFCGQYSETYDALDHTRVWLDPGARLVLTGEPYNFDAVAVAQAVAHLPVQLTGPLPGVWDPRAVLLMLRWDSGKPPLAAGDRVWDAFAGDWVGPKLTATGYAGDWVRSA